MVPTRTEAASQGAVNNQGMRGLFEGGKSRSEPLEFRQEQSAHFVAGLAMQRQFDDAVHWFPGDRFALVAMHFWFADPSEGDLFGLLCCVHVFNVAGEAPRDGIALQLAVRRHQTVVRRKGFTPDPKGPHLLVVR